MELAGIRRGHSTGRFDGAETEVQGRHQAANAESKSKGDKPGCSVRSLYIPVRLT